MLLKPEPEVDCVDQHKQQQQYQHPHEVKACGVWPAFLR
jgi:hypothetical protein